MLRRAFANRQIEKNDTGAEPSPAYFNIIMHGEEEEVLDGTQLAADWTFSGLQKFGQGLLDRLRGLRLNNKLLEKVGDYDEQLSICRYILNIRSIHTINNSEFSIKIEYIYSL